MKGEEKIEDLGLKMNLEDINIENFFGETKEEMERGEVILRQLLKLYNDVLIAVEEEGEDFYNDDRSD